MNSQAYLGVHQQLAAVPVGEVVRFQQEQVLPVLPADHHVAAADLLREQRHALVARRIAGHRHQLDRAEIAGPQQFRADAAARKGGVGAEIFLAAVVMGEMGEAQVLQPVGLGRRDREDHRARQVGVLVAGTRVTGPSCIACRGPAHRPRSRTAAPGASCSPPSVRHQPLAEGDRADVALAHRAQRHQDPDGVPVEAALVGMRHDAGVHQRRGGIAIFVAEIGADQLLPLVADPGQRQVRAARKSR